MNKSDIVQEFLDDIKRICEYYEYVFDGHSIEVDSHLLDQYDTMWKSNRGVAMTSPGMQTAKLTMNVILTDAGS